jgi:hypothetical protein
MKNIYVLLAILSAAPASAQLSVAVTFQVDMSQESVSLYGVHLYGSVQGYNPASTPMTDQGNNIYQATLNLDASTIYYYCFVNGNTLSDLETVPAPCDSGISNLREFVTAASGAMTLGPYCFESCDPCPPQSYAITFQVDMSQQVVSGSGVHIAATFNAFSPSATAMTDQGGGIYTHTETLLSASTVDYAFVNGTTSGEMEVVPAPCAVGNYRQLTVPSATTTLNVVCFESCNPCVTGMPDQPGSQALILPTVSAGSVVVRLSGLEKDWCVIDLTGKRLMDGRISNGSTPLSIDLSALPSGIYTLSLRREGGVASGRFVIAR